MRPFLQAFSYCSHGTICLNKDLQLRVLVPLLKVKMFSVTFHFERTYTNSKWGKLFHCNTCTKNITKTITFLTLVIMQLWHLEKMTNFLTPTPTPVFRKNEQ